MIYLPILLMFILVGCNSTGVVPIYMIAKRSAQVGFGPPDGVKADVYREANEFCAKENLVVETLNLEVTNSGFARAGNVSLNFALSDSELNHNFDIDLSRADLRWAMDSSLVG